MKIRLYRRQIIFSIGCIIGLASAASAAEDVNVIELKEVVVTATRTNSLLSDAPAAVTVVNDKTIETKNASRLGDALDQVPSLYLRGGALGQSQGTIGTSGMSLRGIDQNKTLILIDGHPIQDASSGKVNWRIPFIEDIARVEVVPGAFSSLYGSNAIGGVINIITKQPDKYELTAKMKMSSKDAKGEDGSIYFRNKLDNGFGFVGGYGFQSRRGYVNDFVVKTPVACPPAPTVCGTPVTGAQPVLTREGVPSYLVGDMGSVPWEATNATAKLSYDLNARDKIHVGIHQQKTNVGYTRYNTYLANTATGAPISSGTLDINGQRVTMTNYDFTLFSYSPLYEAATRYVAGYNGTIGNDYLLKVDIAQIKREYKFTMANPTATWDSGSGTLSDTPNNGIDGTIQLTFPASTNQIMVAGMAIHKDSVNQQISALSDWRNPGSTTAINSGYNGYSTMASVFAQDEIAVADELKVFLGGRLDKWETKGNNFSVVAPVGSTFYPTRNASAFSPKASAVYKPTETTILRASFGRSFRAPTNQDMYTSSTSRGRTTTGDPNLQPERGTTWEVGGEFRFSGKTKATATYFDTRLSDLIYVKQILPDPAPPALKQSIRINAGKAKVRGIELGANTALADWLELDANYAYIDSEMLENTTDPLSVGKRLTDSPKNITGIGLTAQQGAWSGTLSARYVSHIFWTAQNTDVVEGVPGSYDAHTMVNAKLVYKFAKEIKWAVAVNNLMNSKAYSYFLLPGRNLTAEMELSF